MKTYEVLFVTPHGNGWAIINSDTVNSVRSILENQSKFQPLDILHIKERKVICGLNTSIIYEGHCETLMSPYDLAVSQGYEGSLEEWLESLKGESAYEIWLDQGHTGTEEDFLDWLRESSSTSLQELNDVNVDSPSDNQALIYNNTTQKWENKNIPECSLIVSFTENSNHIICNVPIDTIVQASHDGKNIVGRYVMNYQQYLYYIYGNVENFVDGYIRFTFNVSQNSESVIIEGYKSGYNDRWHIYGNFYYFTQVYKSKLEGIEDGAEVNVQSDWNQSNSSADDFIKNKPTIPSAINDLSDVDITSAVNQNVLIYDSVSSKWKNATIPTGVTSLSALSDVALTSLANGQMLQYNSTSQKWENVDIPSDAFICTLTETTVDDTTTYSCDKTSTDIRAAANSGKVVLMKWSASGNTIYLPISTDLSGSYNMIVFGGLTSVGIAVAYIGIICIIDNGVDVWDVDSQPFNYVAFSGNYSDLSNLPTLGTAAALDVAASGNASTSQVVKGDDTRLSDSRNAADVYSWAKAATKPTYTASEVGAIPITYKGANNGVAELDSSGKVPSSQLPSYVDDVINGYLYNGVFYKDSAHTTAITPEADKIYVELATNKTYRWSGSSYAEISESLALGETSSTAYPGDKGKANADAIAAIKDGTTIDSFGDVETALADKINKVSNATNDNFAALDSNGNLKDSGAKDSDYVHITGAETITGVKKFTQPVTIQNGAGPGSLIFGADVNAGTLTHNTRKLGRINSPTEDVRNGSTATLLGWDTQGNLADDMHTANRNYDTVSFGGMKKISTNTSPMNIVFCVTKIRNSKVPADKVYPIEMDANEVRFNVQPNYVGNRLLNTTDILDSTSSTATDKAATPNAVKSAYDLAAAAIPKSLGTAAGDIIYYTANGTPARLAKGTTGQVLTINSGATAPEWTDVPTELPALTNNANKILAVNSGATGVEWINNSGGGGGLTNHDFTHTANQSVSGSVTVTYAANTRGSRMVTASADLSVTFAVNNSSDNYLWIKNTGSSDIDILISSVTYNNSSVSNVYMPDDGIAVPAGKVCEIGIVCNADGAFITSRSDLSL